MKFLYGNEVRHCQVQLEMVGWTANLLVRNLNTALSLGRSYPVLSRKKVHHMSLSFHYTLHSRSIPWQAAEEIKSSSSSSDPTVNFSYLYQALHHQTLAGNEILLRSEPLCMTNCLSRLHDKCHCQCCGLHSLNYMTKPDSMEGRWSYLSICVCTFDSILLLFKISCSDGKEENLRL